jgi:hypothetical protein
LRSSFGFKPSSFAASERKSAYDGVHATLLSEVLHELQLPLGVARAGGYDLRAHLLCAIMEPKAACEEAVSIRDRTTSLGVTPLTSRHLAISSAHPSMSLALYATTVGLPVVPEDACILTIVERSADSIPSG